MPARWGSRTIGLAAFATVIQSPALAAPPDPAAPPNSAASADNGRRYYAKADWKAPPGFINMSIHAYHDRNRNGVYDLGDWPMAKVAVEMIRPDGKGIFNWSNIDGFANFQMAAPPGTGDITAPGTYQFTAIVPPGWRTTSGNLVQQRAIIAVPGSMTGLAGASLPVPVGFAPELVIRGRLAGPGSAGAAITARGPGGLRLDVRADAGGLFSFDAAPGRWELEAGGIKRAVTVDYAPVLLSAMQPDRKLPGPASRPFTLQFDELVSAPAVLEIPNGFGGLNWWSWVATHDRFYNGEGYVNGTVSGHVAIYNSSGQPAEISRQQPFDFVGGYFSVAWLKAEGEVLNIRAWRGETLAYEDSIELSALGPVYFDADYRSVTRIAFATEHNWQAIADDLTFRTNP